jgi:hypothetical protein
MRDQELGIQGPGTDIFAIQYSENGRASRKELPPEAQSALFDVLDVLAANPDAFPGRIRAISRDGVTRLYSHPSPPLQVTYEVDIARRVLHLMHFVAPKLQVMKPVFISYSHKDAQWLEKLRQFLRPLEARELIRVWDDTEIRPGSDWLGEIRQALNSARVAVFLVTQNLLDSPFIREKELPALLEAAKNKGCLIFWIAVSSTTIEDSPLAKFQAVNSPTNPLDLMQEPEQNRVWTEIYQKMKDAVSV